MKRLAVSICVLMLMCSFGLPGGRLAAWADDFPGASESFDVSVVDDSEVFELARLSSRRFVRRPVERKSTLTFKRDIPRPKAVFKPLNLFSTRRVNDIRRTQRPILKDLNLRSVTLGVPRKDFINPRKGVLQRSRNVQGRLNAQQGEIMKQFDTEKLRRR